MTKQRILYVILPFITMVIALLITYWLNQVYAEAFGIQGVDYSYIFLDFNNLIPFIDWTIYPYVSAYLFWPLTFFYVGYRSKRNVYTILLISLVTFTICGIWYFFFQSDVQAWRETSGLFFRPMTDLNFTERLVMTIYNSAGPRNALPSMHCVMCWVAICGVRLDKKMPLPAKLFIIILSVVIMISTQTTKQHYIIDTIAAVAICEAAYWILKKSPAVNGLEHFYSQINGKLGIDWDGQI
ncbi:MAG: phosphatase PAP2 family protein [Candidatus Izemoplasmatales bacterium]|nr:phosphatase PAP2 family protein [Candidatus Izemoplasmatales bacterium]MDD4596037.1 phosphatase PAP2 family protein [Candidatus Izemoplasmatales bacterium]